MRLPDTNKLPSSMHFKDANKPEDVYAVTWKLQFSFNKKFYESPLEVSRELLLQFQGDHE